MADIQYPEKQQQQQEEQPQVGYGTVVPPVAPHNPYPGAYNYQEAGYAAPASHVPYGPGFAHAFPVERNGTWSTDFCDCAQDTPSCCDVFFCTWCHSGYQYGMMSTGQQHMHPAMCLGTALCDFLTGFGTIVGALVLRSAIRERYGIKGNDFEDILLAFCCPACTLCQNYREMSVRGQWPGGICVSAPYSKDGGFVRTQEPAMTAESH